MLAKLWLRAQHFSPAVAVCRPRGLWRRFQGRDQAKVKGRVKFFDKYSDAPARSRSRPADGQDGYRQHRRRRRLRDGQCPGRRRDGDGLRCRKHCAARRVVVPRSRRQGVPEMRPPGEAGGRPDHPGIDPSKIVQIPGKYADVKTSGLKYTRSKRGPRPITSPFPP